MSRLPASPLSRSTEPLAVVRSVSSLLAVLACGVSLPVMARGGAQTAEDGWVSLFDGRSLEGWRGRDGESPPPSWSVEDGVLRRSGDARSGGIRTEGVWGDFVLHLEFRAEGESGVFLRGRHEIKLRAGSGLPGDGRAAGDGGRRLCGALSGRRAPRVNAARPRGAWQSLDVACVGDRVTVALNQVRVLHRVPLGEPAPRALEDEGRGPGPVLLQGGRGTVDFRRIRLRPLPEGSGFDDVARVPGWTGDLLGGDPGRDADEPPPVPIGADAFLRWEEWPRLRIGVRAYMRSTFDRKGGNHFADAGHFIRLEDDAHAVALDEAGPGILWFVRHNHWHGSPWSYRVDGHEAIVRESSTEDPTQPVEGSVFLPKRPFPSGLTWTWATTKGADLSWVPIPFERRLRLSYGRTRYGTGYFILWKLMPGLERLSRPLEGWTEDRLPPYSVLRLLDRAGHDIAPWGTARSGTFDLDPRERRTVLELDGGARTLRHLGFRVPAGSAEALARGRLRITWDGRRHPSVDAPLGLFFGTGSLLRDPGQEWIVRSFPMTVRHDGSGFVFGCRFPMPFRESVRIELSETTGQAVEGIEWSVRWTPNHDPANWNGLFHATWRDVPHPEPGRDIELLDTREVEGGGLWCGHIVGTTYVFTRDGELSTLEGDPRFFLDDSLSPQGQGTGSEEWGGGGDYWGGRTMTLPFAGHPVGRPPGEQETQRDRLHSAYRFLLTDLIPFGRNARFTLEHGGRNDSREHYETVTYWYGIDRPGLVLTDELDVGDTEDEARHGYVSPEGTEPETVTSRFELGPHRVPLAAGEGEAEIVPPTADDGRRTTGASEMTLRIHPRNLGVLLRRRIDLAWHDQRARVLVADADAPGEPQWGEAGTWYTAGGRTAIFADPLGLPPDERGDMHPELAPPARIPWVSDRRLREVEFLLPRRLTEGRSRIRVRFEHRPLDEPLLPGGEPPPSAWTELRYRAYSIVMPRVTAPPGDAAALDAPILEALRTEAAGGRSWQSEAEFVPAGPGDVVLEAETGAARGAVRAVDDRRASGGRALEIRGRGSDAPAARAEDAADLVFEAPAGEYTVFLRGATGGGIRTDACWLQFDDEIGTPAGATPRYGFGNWRDRWPAGAYAWSSAMPSGRPWTVRLEHDGRHRLRIAPRHTPFRIDQVWLARHRRRLPRFVVPVRPATRRDGPDDGSQ